MSWTKDDERLLQIVSETEELMRNEAERDSYWCMRESDETGIMEYGFEIFPEMRQFLCENIEDKQVALFIGATAMKNKTIVREKMEEQDSVQRELARDVDIPEFVYVF